MINANLNNPKTINLPFEIKNPELIDFIRLKQMTGARTPLAACQTQTLIAECGTVSCGDSGTCSSSQSSWGYPMKEKSKEN